MDIMRQFEEILEGSAKVHGHLCPGQVVGVRMALEGCRLIGLENPKELTQLKKLIVFVEMDRCAADAISYVTGVTLGRRSLKFVDNGIMAATFLNIETKKAFRLVSTEHSRELAKQYAPEYFDRKTQQLEGYKRMPVDALFTIEEVRVELDPADLPGPTRHKAICSQCGQVVRDKKEVIKDNRVFCRHCAGDSYFCSIKK